MFVRLYVDIIQKLNILYHLHQCIPGTLLDISCLTWLGGISLCLLYAYVLRRKSLVSTDTILIDFVTESKFWQNLTQREI